MKNKENIKIILESFDHAVLNRSMIEIINTVKKTGAIIKGPVPLPTKIQKFCVIRGPHVDKDSREQFEIRDHSRFLIIEASPQAVDALMKLDIAAGVDIQIKMKGAENERK